MFQKMREKLDLYLIINLNNYLFPRRIFLENIDLTLKG